MAMSSVIEGEIRFDPKAGKVSWGRVYGERSFNGKPVDRISSVVDKLHFSPRSKMIGSGRVYGEGSFNGAPINGLFGAEAVAAFTGNNVFLEPLPANRTSVVKTA